MRFIYLLIGLLSAPAFALQVGVVDLTVGTQYCSGTILKAENGKCHLLTAAHCAEMSPIWQVSSQGTGTGGQWIAGPAKGVINQPLPIIRADRDRDLAEIKWPTSLNNFCKQIEPFAMRTAEELIQNRDPVALFGILGQNVLMMTRDDGPWPRHAIASERKIYSYGGIDDLQIENVRGLRGLSGGPVVDLKGNLLGIYKKFIPRDDVILVSTTYQIQEFLNNLNPPRSIQFCPQTTGRYNNGGGNSHGNGGGNSFINGNGSDPETMAHWMTFLEPAEGILNPQNCSSVILGKGDARIDGPEDYEKLMRVPGPWIERPAAGLPNEKIRRGILDRFVGSYVSKSYSRTNNYSIHYGYVELAQANLRTQSKIRLDIQKRGSSEYVILMTQEQAKMYSYVHPELGGVIPDSVTEIIARVSPNADQVELTQQLYKYTCINENYLKLVCEGGGVLFSVSKSSVNDKSLKLRYTRGMQARLRDDTVYRFFMHMIDDLVKVK